MPQENENSFLMRIVKCSMFNSDAYEDVEHDEGAMPQALIIVLISGTALGLYQSKFFFDTFSPGIVLVSVIYGMLSWALFAWITYFVGTRIFRTNETESAINCYINNNAVLKKKVINNTDINLKITNVKKNRRYRLNCTYFDEKRTLFWYGKMIKTTQESIIF